MPREMAIAAVTGTCLIMLWASGPPSADGMKENSGDNNATARGLLERVPASSEEWETQKAQVRRWLAERLQLGQDDGATLHTCRESRQKGYILETLAWSDSQDEPTWQVLIPARHKGRGPAVIYFGANGEESGRPAERQLPSDVTRLVQTGYLVLVAPEEGHLVRDDAACRYLLKRLDVDPERVAVFAAGPGLRRGWVVAAMQEEVAAVVSLGDSDTPLTDERSVEARALLRLIAPRPHRLCTSAPRLPLEFVRRLYATYDLPQLFHATLLAEHGSSSPADVKEAALRWLKDEL
jgi:hypothetical protein